MGIDHALTSLFILALESLALATAGPLVMADFTKPPVFTQEGPPLHWQGASGPVKKNSLPVNQNGGRII
jgi:hypothetical protein